MPWTLIDSATEGDALLELYRKGDRFMIRAHGFELMNGFCHDSEAELGRLAAALAPCAEPRILLGGLGLGYTAASLAQALGKRGAITVAEFSAAVIDWFHLHVRATVLPKMPGNLTIVHADVAALLMTVNQYDLIVVDIDNGPDPLVTATNGGLYAVEGLVSLHRSLAREGKVMVWSGFESAAFVARAAEAGFQVRCERYRRARAELSHYIYVLEKCGDAGNR